jgi:hypothetical protein
MGRHVRAGHIHLRISRAAGHLLLTFTVF